MRILRWLGAVAALLLALAATHMVLVEGGEVVVLKTQDAAGTLQETRLWFVTSDGTDWVAAGSAEAAWLGRIQAQPVIEASAENGPTGRFRAVPVPERRAEVLALMAEKYGFADRWVRFMVGTEAVPVRLEPIVDGSTTESR